VEPLFRSAREENVRIERGNFAAIERLGLLQIDWLGVRDDFRNWVIRTA